MQFPEYRKTLTDIVGKAIGKITEGQNLTADEAEEAFATLFEKDLESYFFFVFMAALHTKGETSDELLGFCRANERILPKVKIGIDPRNIIDTSGTGGDLIKTFNVSTAVAFILASANVYVAKQAFYAVTGFTGSADLLGAFGVDVMSISRGGVENVVKILEKEGIVPYVAQFLGDPNKSKGIFHWVEKRKEIGLNFITAFHLAANAYTPIPMERRIYGMFDKKYLRVVAELFQKMGYKKVLVFHGDDGLDEISNIGKTSICELSDGLIKEYSITPEELGIKRAKIEDIRAKSREGNIVDFLRVIYDKDRGPKADLVYLNAGAAFYVLDKVSTIREGIDLAKSLVESGKAAEKLEQFVKNQGSSEKLETWKKAL
jgi:anthranilate phosphoribosyltransferase